MRAGQIIQRSDLTISAVRLKRGLFIPDLQEFQPRYGPNGTIAARSLQPGMNLSEPLYDDRGLLLVPPRTTLSQRIIDQITSRRLRWLHVRPPDTLASAVSAQPAAPVTSAAVQLNTSDSASRRHEPVPMQTPLTRQLDLLLAESSVPQNLSPHSRRAMPARSLTLADLRQEAQAGRNHYRQAMDRYAQSAWDALRGRSINVAMAHDILSGFARVIERDPSLPLLIMELRRDQDEYLFHHAMNVAMLSMSMAAGLGCPSPQVLEVGVGALFADVGMLRVPSVIRLAQRKLTADEWSEIERHPIHSVDTLERLGSLSKTSLLITYQSHERCDRSGYPRQRHRQFIHPMARIVAVADTYAALVCPRPHRQPHSPFQGMTTLLREAARGGLDKDMVRALLQTTSLFPVGSYVRLSDGTRAQVVRSNGVQVKCPVVTPLQADGSPGDCELDLSKTNSVQVTAALDDSDLRAPHFPSTVEPSPASCIAG